MFTRAGKTLTAKGVKPKCQFQQVFISTYLFGAFSPLTGDHFILDLPFCNATTFQLYLDEFSKQNETELKVIVLDNGPFHKAKCLIIPKNIVLVFLPPYSPELNPAEKVWAKFKRAFSNQFFKTIEDLQTFTCNLSNSLTVAEVKSITNYKYTICSFWSA